MKPSITKQRTSTEMTPITSKSIENTLGRIEEKLDGITHSLLEHARVIGVDLEGETVSPDKSKSTTSGIE